MGFASWLGMKGEGAGLPKAWLRAKRGLAPVLGNWVFVVSMPCGGNVELQNALNASPDIFLLGGPELMRDDGRTGFARRYQAFHKAAGDLPAKSTALPKLRNDDPRWWDWLTTLAKHHRIVGARLSLTPADVALFEVFAAQLFYKSRFIFVFRHPLVVAHAIRLQQFGRAQPLTDWDVLFKQYLEIVKLYTRVAGVLPHVRLVVHEDVTPALLSQLGADLGCDIGGARAYYAEPAVGLPTVELPAEADGVFHFATKVFGQLRAIGEDADPLAQREQNTESLDEGGRTKLGSLAMMLDPGALARAAR